MSALSRANRSVAPVGASATGTGRILVIRGGAIGDFILTLPVLAALREQFPQCPVEVLGYPHITGLALESGLADATRSIESSALARFFATGSTLDGSWAEYFRGFALILSYLYDPEGVFQANVARCSKAQFIPCPHRPNERLNLHATESFLQPLERLAIFNPNPVPRLTFQCPDPFAPAQNAISRTLVLHPGSGSEQKNWPEHAWQSLLAHLTTVPDWDFLLVGGEAEGERVTRLAGRHPSNHVRQACNLPLSDLAIRLSSCRAFIGHDSGISHLAAAVGLPGLVLWGDTNETIWRPRSSRFRILRSPGGLQALEVSQVIDELYNLLSGSE